MNVSWDAASEKLAAGLGYGCNNQGEDPPVPSTFMNSLVCLGFRPDGREEVEVMMPAQPEELVAAGPEDSRLYGCVVGKSPPRTRAGGVRLPPPPDYRRSGSGSPASSHLCSSSGESFATARQEPSGSMSDLDTLAAADAQEPSPSPRHPLGFLKRLRTSSGQQSGESSRALAGSSVSSPRAGEPRSGVQLSVDTVPSTPTSAAQRYLSASVTCLSSGVHPTRVPPDRSGSSSARSPGWGDADDPDVPPPPPLLGRGTEDPSVPDVDTPAYQALQANEGVRVTKFDKLLHAVKYQSIRRIGKAASLHLGGLQKRRRGKPPRAVAREFYYTSNELLLRPSPIIEEEGESTQNKPRTFHRIIVRGRRRKKKKERPPHASGKVIDGEHEKYVLSIAIMLGIRTVVEATKEQLENFRQNAAEGTPWLDLHDFFAVEKYLFPARGGPRTRPHSLKHTFKFKVYSPNAFSYLRRMFGVCESDFINSLCGKANFIEFISNAKSGQFFFYSLDGKYMVKTMSDEESKFLRRILPHYFRHCAQYANSMLPRFMGMYRVKLYHVKKNVTFLVMQSVYGSGEKEKHKQYDLKGSVLGRKAKPGEVVLKDNDIRSRLDENAFYLDPRLRDQMKQQLLHDMDFFRANKIMDYSMLVGVHEIGRAPRTPGGGKHTSSSFRLQLSAAEDGREQHRRVGDVVGVPPRDEPDDVGRERLGVDRIGGPERAGVPEDAEHPSGGAGRGGDELDPPAAAVAELHDDEVRVPGDVEVPESGSMHVRSLSAPSKTFGEAVENGPSEGVGRMGLLDRSESGEALPGMHDISIDRSLVSVASTKIISNLARDSFSPGSSLDDTLLSADGTNGERLGISADSMELENTISADQPFYDAYAPNLTEGIIDYHLEEDDDYSYLDGETYFRGTNDALISSMVNFDASQGVPISSLPEDIVENIEWRKEMGSEQLFWPFHRLYDVQGRRRIQTMKKYTFTQVVDDTDGGTTDGGRPQFAHPLSVRKDGGFEQAPGNAPIPTGDTVRVGGKVIYMGLLDVLQQYTIRKRAEAAFRRLFTANRTDASAVNPELYADRFLEFFGKYVREDRLVVEGPRPHTGEIAEGPRPHPLLVDGASNGGIESDGLELPGGGAKEPEMTPLIAPASNGTTLRRRKKTDREEVPGGGAREL
eukprot:CAMPEP_0194285178 /NCGR_PEP_ID=MMETSP0169-20130528/29571_1 /TAXON_ID=218684 /ORGANISM="Corethron pennatum, Strain L29A3" /LENGTH=1159 /DNA_ID=CAMNT_0039031231 /DNA_START=141 /DNA_END=3617 /DNA_ORIENTATION=+